MMFSRYYILSFQLILSPHLTYCQYVAFYNASLISSQGTALNICYSLALIIYSLAILIILFLMTKKLTPHELMT